MKNNLFTKLANGRPFYNKRFTITLSIILAFAFWMVIMLERNPIRNQTIYNVPATVSIDNTSAKELGLGIISDVTSQKYKVTVNGPNYVVSSLRPEDLVLTADVADVNAAGTYTLNIGGVINAAKNGCTITAIEPKTIDVYFDYIDTKEFLVVPRLVGVVAQDGLVAEAPVITNADDEIVTIKGPRALVDQIATVGAYAEVNKTLSATENFDTDIVLYNENNQILYRYAASGAIFDKEGNPIESNSMTVSKTSVKVTAPISKKATLSVKATFENLPAAWTAAQVPYQIDHASVTVIGTPEVIDNMKEVVLAPIDFTKVSKNNNQFQVAATLPEGAKLLDNIENFSVTVNLKGYSEKVLDITKIRYKGLNSSLTAQISSAIKNVRICGKDAEIKSLTAADVFALVDVTDKAAGEYTINVLIKSDKYSSVWQIGSYSTSVRLK